VSWRRTHDDRTVVLAVVSDMHAGSSGTAPVEARHLLSQRPVYVADRQAGHAPGAVLQYDFGLLLFAYQDRNQKREQGAKLLSRGHKPNVQRPVLLASAVRLPTNRTESCDFAATLKDPQIGIRHRQSHVEITAGLGDRETAFAVYNPGQIAYLTFGHGDLGRRFHRQPAKRNAGRAERAGVGAFVRTEVVVPAEPLAVTDTRSRALKGFAAMSARQRDLPVVPCVFAPARAKRTRSAPLEVVFVLATEALKTDTTMRARESYCLRHNVVP